MQSSTHPIALRLAAAALVALTAGALPGAAAAAETLRVGKVVAQNFGFVPLNVGVAAGFFQKQGLAIEESDFAGGAKQQQALIAGSIDIAIGGGSDLAFIAKGVPEIAIAIISASPKFMGWIIGKDSPIKTIDDLKGKKIGVTTAGSLSKWLVDELNRTKGWGSAGAIPVAIGGQLATEIAALKTHEVASFIDAPAIGFQLQQEGEGSLLMTTDTYVKHLEVFIIYAADALVKRDPTAASRFLKGWFEAVAYMAGHKPETLEIARKITGFSKPVEEREYDLLMPQFSRNGRFDQPALKTLATSFVALKILDHEPDMSTLYTEQYLPKP